MDLSTEPPVVVLKARRAVYALALLVFGLVDLFAIGTSVVFGEFGPRVWAFIGVAGLMTAAVALLTWSPGLLAVDRHGFALTRFGITTRLHWTEIERLGLAAFSGQRVVAYGLTEEARRHRSHPWDGVLRFASGLGGFDRALIGYYGMPPEKLLDLMEKGRGGRQAAP